ncbi:heavy-metal-associated domain-containing protein [Glaciimonas sp. Gout2]|nr:heavy-metal-associated domain-containing protein [Glaciimonas sp. Cout2]MEB0081263.1 heavy-metal-associated domain-containing protein [Glaciimonas sp. Gout2]
MMIVFNVQDMTCGHCVDRITKAINAVDSRAKVEAQVAEKKIAIESDADAGQLAQAIEGAGYTPVQI